MCNCISDFNKMLIEKTGDPEARVNTSFSISFSETTSVSKPYMTCSYRIKKKDGTFLKPADHPISGEFCPFCGKRYLEEASK